MSGLREALAHAVAGLEAQAAGGTPYLFLNLGLLELQALLAAHPDGPFEASAWDAGHQAGWEHHQDGEHGNDYWDCDCTNPHRVGAS